MDQEHYSLKEIELSNYTRKFKLNDNLEREASATYENGVLMVVVKKKILPVKK